ncbi:stability determinant [Sphingomonas sp. BIUV-7]|uniref:Stability determinant n=1 Tax=Sphingomonas natans TaxID=3063330 RepID=A0ABT8Y5Y6_9SPHN|nr:stability determinant [Sphingomonas sp. BIUV-7]MDO6413734.1 stability determinant [Sphingomonas sp. BIUV-7]
MTRLTPIESEFATSEDAEAHDRWFREKVEVALASTAPPVAHDEVIAEARKIIEARKGAASRRAS